MATAGAQLDPDQSGSQMFSSTHWGADCSDGGLCSDATSANNSKPLLNANWQSLYAKRSGVKGSSSQMQADVSCFAMQQQRCESELQSGGTAADPLGEPQRDVSSATPATPGGLAVPPARYLKLSCEPLAGNPAGLFNKHPETPHPAPAPAVGAAKQAGSGCDSRRQLQQWLARHEASVITKSIAGAASSSSTGTAAAEDEELPGHAFQLAQALPPPAFLILGGAGLNSAQVLMWLRADCALEWQMFGLLNR